MINHELGAVSCWGFCRKSSACSMEKEFVIFFAPQVLDQLAKPVTIIIIRARRFTHLPGKDCPLSCTSEVETIMTNRVLAEGGEQTGFSHAGRSIFCPLFMVPVRFINNMLFCSRKNANISRRRCICPMYSSSFACFPHRKINTSVSPVTD